ncbi:hypothetical protein BN14_11192 [Rhizoctonia solani AG-1 IB]|uniref:Fungal zn(2)-Cys(6) binuclear cluster domain-containing protein n=1 Tax=Thanatephorus cucumeris (strain AG1-IB / isolate 7/3/14) TaxID=1108050 RepID=M5CH08_THACB|nr:hypothetical protein BN14_11192 [Rhizoctonia solani AG-1 IB]
MYTDRRAGTVKLGDRSVPVGTSRLLDNSSANPAIDRPQPNFDSPGWLSDIPLNQDTHHPYIPYEQYLIPPFGYIPAPLIKKGLITTIQAPTPPLEDSVGASTSQIRAGRRMNPGQASLFDAIFSLADDPPTLPRTPESLGSSVVFGPDTKEQDANTGYNSESQSPVESSDEQPTGVEDDADVKTLQVGLLSTLALDQEVESNITPFISYAFTSWMSRFVFEPVRGISLARHTIIRGHSSGAKILQRIILVAKTVLAISRSTNYEMTHFVPLHDQLMDGVIKAREQEKLTKSEALEAMDCCHELLTISIRVSSLASVLNMMALCAPIFRRVCPESDEELVNLPSRLMATEINLKFYATLDVVQSVITHRPMLFRYDVGFLSPDDKIRLNKADGPGLRWLHGVPDRLVVILARMNSLLEDYGNRVGSQMVQELEKDIMIYEPIVSSSLVEDSSLCIGRAMVQESWRLATYNYLYMALCGADSSDMRVIKIQKKFMRLLKVVYPRRNPDLFLVVPIIIALRLPLLQTGLPFSFVYGALRNAIG